MSLFDKLLILALASQVLLTLGILLWMGRERVPRVMRGEIAIKDIAIDRAAYPKKARLLSNSFDNQFQLPVLFYVAGLILLWTGLTGWFELALVWIFVGLRYGHAWEHITRNDVIRRFGLYSAGLVVLALLWLWLVLRLVVLEPSM
jgi:hypothetical protein